MFNSFLGDNEKFDEQPSECCNLRSVKAQFLRNKSFKLLNERSEFRNVESLDLCHSEIDIHEDLVWNFTKLRTLLLNNYVKQGEYLAKSIANSPSLSNLQELDVSNNQIVRFQIEPITSSDSLKNLTSLTISNNNLEEDGCELLLKSKFASSLTYLDMEKCSPDFNEFTKGLSKHFSRILQTFTKLKTLNFSRNCLLDDGLLAVESLGNLTSLDLSKNYLSENSKSFFDKPIFDNLTNLDLFYNRFESDFHVAILKNPTLENLSSIIMDLQIGDFFLGNMVDIIDNIQHVKHLKSLNVQSYCESDELPLINSVVDNLSSLTLVKLYRERPIEMKDMKFLPNLTFLNLESFSGMDYSSLDVCVNLKTFKLNSFGLDIRELCSCSFIGNLKELSLQACSLKDVDLIVLSECGKTNQLISLFLTVNGGITSIEVIVLNHTNFKNLQLLDVSSTSCHQIPPTSSLHQFPKLTCVKYGTSFNNNILSLQE